MKLTNLVPQDFKRRIQIEVDEILMNTLGVLLIVSALIQVVTVLCLVVAKLKRYKTYEQYYFSNIFIVPFTE